MSDWLTTRAKFRRIAAQKGIRKIAEEIPAHFTTVYRLLKGEHEHPSKAVEANIGRIVEEHADDQQEQKVNP